MFKIFETPIPKRVLEDFYTIPREYPNLAYILINLQDNIINNIEYPTTGDLYAISDQEGLEQLYNEANKLQKQGIRNMTDTIALEDEIGVLE